LCAANVYGWMLLQDCPHVSRTKEDFYTVRCQVTDMKNLYVSSTVHFLCLTLPDFTLLCFGWGRRKFCSTTEVFAS